MAPAPPLHTRYDTPMDTFETSRQGNRPATPPSRPAPVGRFAPSPSGHMHLGNAFSYLLAWLGARSQGGRVVLRIEDLDERSKKPELADAVMEDLEWLGLTWDEGPWYQSRRQDVYEQALEQLSCMGLTYSCFCTRHELHAASAPHASDGTYIYQGTCRNLSPDEIAEKTLVRQPATRLMVPGREDPSGAIAFCDLVYGPQHEVLAEKCGDFLVRRSDSTFAYQLAVVVDDALMGVSQVVRGRDLLGSTARQIYLQRLLGYETPAYAHVPLLVAPDGRRLAKRDHDLELRQLREGGMPPERVIGLLAHAAGIIDEAADVSAQDLLARFGWDGLRQHHNDVVVSEGFVS